MGKMEKINILLDLYFAGETTTEQENELKKYFASNNVAAEHKVYQPLFGTFEIEKSEKYPENLPKIRKQPVRRKMLVISIIATVAAASILLMIGIFQNKYDDTYVIIHGKRINDRELAIQTAQAKINKVSESLISGLKPAENIKKINDNLEALQKIEYIKTKIQHTFDKINIELLYKQI
jgi:hypothetical protein